MKKQLILIVSKEVLYENKEQYEKTRDNIIEELEEGGYVVDIEAEEDMDSAELEFGGADFDDDI